MSNDEIIRSRDALKALGEEPIVCATITKWAHTFLISR